MANNERDTDKILTRRLKTGDVEAFEIIYYKYSRELYLLSMAYLNNCEVAEDILQDAFLYLWEKKDALKDDSIIRAYLRRIIKSMSLNYIRHKKIILKHSKNLSKEHSYPFIKEDEVSSNTEEKELLKQIKFINEKLEDLPASCKKIFIMSVIDGMSYKEVSYSLGLSINTIKTQVKIAYRRLRGYVTLYTKL